MADIAEIQLKIRAVEFALGTFADYENEDERRIFLRQNFTAIPGLKTYFRFPETKLQDTLNKLQEKKICCWLNHKVKFITLFQFFF